MSPAIGKKPLRCAVYARKSTEEGLDQEFNSIDAQVDAGHAYIASQKHEGWTTVQDDYLDPGYSGGNMERPGLKCLLADIERGRIDTVVVYKIDRLTRSLTDFSRMIEVFERKQVSFVSVTQQFNTTTSMGRLMLNVLLSFAQFEREVTGERIRDKIAASKRKGLWMGGMPPLGYDVVDHHLVVNEAEAKQVRQIFDGFVRTGSATKLLIELWADNVTTKSWTTQKGKLHRGQKITKTTIYKLIRNRIFLGEIRHRETWYPGEHVPIIDQELWDRAQSVIQVDSRQRGNQARATVPFLLKGLLVDADGRALQPWSSCKKNGRRYRYYISTREMKEYTGASGLPRLPAEQLEAVVIGQLTHVLRTPTLTAKITDHAFRLDPTLDEAQVSVALLQFERVLSQLLPAEQQRLVQLLIDKIVVSTTTLEIRLRQLGLFDPTFSANIEEPVCA